MARIRIYTNSVLASIISLLGYGLVIVGIALLVSGEVTGGIVMLIIGILLAVWAAGISEKKQFKQWRKDLQAKGLEPRIASDSFTGCNSSLKLIADDGTHVENYASRLGFTFVAK